MPISLEDVVSIIIENTEKRLSPIPVPKKVIYSWADGLDIPRGGKNILYTGLLYQLAPYIDSMVKYLEEMEIRGGTLLKVGKIVSKIIDVSKFISRVSEKDIEKQYVIIRNIALLLKSLGVKFGYLYEDELYSGVLLYDLGIEDVFAKHIKKVYKKFIEYGVKNIITIDPHTTHILRKIYPEFLPDFDINVKNYLEILYELDPKPKKFLNINVVIHDPCFYARYEGIIEPQRKLLEKAGIKILEPERTKELTFCCGGPVESVSPRLSHAVAKMRADELKNKGENIVVMCPLCYINLKRASADIKLIDISSYLYEIYG